MTGFLRLEFSTSKSRQSNAVLYWLAYECFHLTNFSTKLEFESQFRKFVSLKKIFDGIFQNYFQLNFSCVWLWVRLLEEVVFQESLKVWIDVLNGKFRKVTEPFNALISLRKLCFFVSCHSQQKSAMLVKISFLWRPCCVDIENNIYLLGTIVVAQKLFNCRWGKREREMTCIEYALC